MLIEHNARSFLTGDVPFIDVKHSETSPSGYRAGVTFEPHHEGFIGIPHGGLPMGLCLDLWRRSRLFRYPVEVRYKFGGSGIRIGEPAGLEVERAPEDNGPAVTMRITKPNDKSPYLTALMRPASVEHSPHTSSPAIQLDDYRLLPYYRNCFVCGHHRTVAGLKRRFRLHADNGSHAVTTPWGFDDEDLDRAGMFLINDDELHPAVLISIFDENTAWGGFMEVRAAGLSVRLNVTLLRPVARSEKLLFVGRPAGTRGHPKAPRFFKAEGEILSVTDSGNPEPVAYGHGEWVVLASYTEQITNNLLPEDDWSWIFSRGEHGGSSR